uniref:Uncharacterized protein n=1 Tax=Cacopsylla melanoneura TaxID=428564 RepID=A0A8D9F9Z7_9HEMI
MGYFLQHFADKDNELRIRKGGGGGEIKLIFVACHIIAKKFKLRINKNKSYVILYKCRIYIVKYLHYIGNTKIHKQTNILGATSDKSSVDFELDFKLFPYALKEKVYLNQISLRIPLFPLPKTSLQRQTTQTHCQFLFTST